MTLALEKDLMSLRTKESLIAKNWRCNLGKLKELYKKVNLITREK